MVQIDRRPYRPSLLWEKSPTSPIIPLPEIIQIPRAAEEATKPEKVTNQEANVLPEPITKKVIPTESQSNTENRIAQAKASLAMIPPPHTYTLHERNTPKTSTLEQKRNAKESLVALAHNSTQKSLAA